MYNSIAVGGGVAKSRTAPPRLNKKVTLKTNKLIHGCNKLYKLQKMRNSTRVIMLSDVFVDAKINPPPRSFAGESGNVNFNRRV